MGTNEMRSSFPILGKLEQNAVPCASIESSLINNRIGAKGKFDKTVTKRHLTPGFF